MSMWEHIKKDFQSGDPEIMNWALIKPAYLPFLMSTSYLLFVYFLGPHLMKHRRPFKLRILMIFYNLAIVLAYARCAIKATYLFVTTDISEYFCNNASVLQSPSIYELAVISWYIYLLKYVEYLDTIFFVLRKKYHQITILHVFHHALLPICIWTILRTEKGLFQLTIGILNGVVHVVMYTYYGLAAAGIKQEYLWWKKYITRLQMVQLLLIVKLQIFAIYMECYTTAISFYMCAILNILFFILFGNFYIHTYKPRYKKGSKADIVHID
ncbi:elongation of very long chain fatty acids protein 7-like [Uloborus diversus]|uniref:elongation of very long chain fatty acids protein 7-like n=1 Tax=Uloborus diversus TaxID=327109 RepID=UPI002408F542|nr:elongation of very long chain fatty acids protein 7-like [Uloborus diversus]